MGEFIENALTPMFVLIAFFSGVYFGRLIERKDMADALEKLNNIEWQSMPPPSTGEAKRE